MGYDYFASSPGTPEGKHPLVLYSTSTINLNLHGLECLADSYSVARYSNTVHTVPLSNHSFSLDIVKLSVKKGLDIG